MKLKDFNHAFILNYGKEHWVGNTGLKRVPNGLVMMFHDQETDTISSSSFIPMKTLILKE